MTYCAFADGLLPPISALLANAPIIVPYAASAASFAVWCLIGALTVFLGTRFAYGMPSGLSLGVIVAVIFSVLAAVFFDGLVASASQALLAPLPPEIVAGAEEIASTQLADPANAPNALQQFQNYIDSEQGLILQIMSSIFISWITLTVVLNGFVVRR